MTPREMTAEELENAFRCAVESGGTEALRAHIAALRARAEAAEADNAALLDAVYGAHICTSDTCACNRVIKALGEPHPGAGYRAKVRAELLRELAEEHRQAAALAHSLDAFDEGARQESYARGLAAQAAREEQG